MRRIDIFISSHPDVQPERSVAERLIRSIAVEFNLPVTVSYSNRLRKSKTSDKIAALTADGFDAGRSMLRPCFWEYQDFEPEQDYQERIPNTGQYDLVVCILWSRLGMKISPAFVMPDGSRPTSATDYEIAWALDQEKLTPGFPELHVYRNRSIPVAPLEPKEEREAFFKQWDSVQEFFSTWKSDRAFSEVCGEYQDLREFENLFRKHFRDFVAKQLDREIVPREPAPNTRYWKLNPYRGLQIFNFEHAAVFHGRTKAIGEVLTSLKKQASAGRPFVLVLGPRGSGKSSLVRAGVLPFLAEPGSTDGPWRRATARPGVGGATGDPFNRLAAALLAEAALPELQDAAARNAEENLASELRENPQGVARRVTELLDRASRQEMDRVAHEEKNESEMRGRIEDAEVTRHRSLLRINPEAHLALIIDPLEDLFTGDFSPELQRRYIAALGTLIRSGRVFVIATLQSDFYPAYQQFPELIELAGSSGKYDLSPPTPEEIGTMIHLPAEAAGLRFEQDRAKGSGLDKTIFHAAVSSSQPLPLLEHLLSELYRKQALRNDGLLRCSDYVELGQLEGALANHAEILFRMLMTDAQAAFDSVMRRLISFGSGDQAIGRPVLYSEVVSPAELNSRQKEGAKFFVDYFIKEGLFYAEPELTKERIVCISHQSLLEKWPRVRQWLSEHQAFLRMRDRLDARVNLWVRRGRRREDLFGPLFGVTDAQTLLRHFRSSLSKTQIEYIKRILARQKQGDRIRNSLWLAAGIGLVLLAAVAGIRWYNAETEKKGAEKLTSVERRIDQIAAASRNGRDREPKQEKDDSQTEQIQTGMASDEAGQAEAGLKKADVQGAQDEKVQINQPAANVGAKASPAPNNGPIQSEQDRSNVARIEQNRTGDVQSTAAIATSREPGPSESPVDGNTNGTSDEQQLKKFVVDYLETVGSDDVSTQERFFSHRVDYFDQGVLSLRRLQEAKESYNRQWPTREWKPQREAEIQYNNNSKLYEIVQPYTWTASDGSKLDQGSGSLYMRVYKTSKGNFHIVHIERRD